MHKSAMPLCVGLPDLGQSVRTTALNVWKSWTNGQNPRETQTWEKSSRQSGFLRGVWTDMERRSRAVWALQAGGTGIIPGGPLGKSSPGSGKGGWQKQKGLPSFVGRYG